MRRPFCAGFGGPIPLVGVRTLGGCCRSCPICHFGGGREDPTVVSAPRVHCWMCPIPLRVHLLGSAREPGLRGIFLWEGFGPVFGQALGSRLPAAVFNAGFTPAACRGWFLSADIFGWRSLETNINCTTNVAVIIYGGQDRRCVEGGAEPIGLDQESWNHTSGGLLRLGQLLRLRLWYPIRCRDGFLGNGFWRGRLVVRPSGSSCSFGATVWDTLCKEVVRCWAPRASAPAFRDAESGWRGNVRRGMAPRGDRLLEKEKL